jgi:hypothetical protein
VSTIQSITCVAFHLRISASALLKSNGGFPMIASIEKLIPGC